MASKEVTQFVWITADAQTVWNALTDPQAGRKWRMAEFKTDWRPGSRIEIEATIGARRYRDKGTILIAEPPSLLRYSYGSRVSGLPDIPQSWSTVTIALEARGNETAVTVTQQVPPSPVRRGAGWEIGSESGWKHVEFYWRTTLPVLKSVIEQDHPAEPLSAF